MARKPQTVPVEVYAEVKDFVGFTDADSANLVAMGPLFADKGPGITDAFYEELGRNPKTSPFLEGRVDALKATHSRWMSELFSGDYGQEYFDNRMRIGLAHVRIGLDPWWVEGTMTHLRVAGAATIQAHVDSAKVESYTGSLLRILDLDLMLINLAYGEERLERLTRFTGMGRRLIENCIRQG